MDDDLYRLNRAHDVITQLAQLVSWRRRPGLYKATGTVDVGGAAADLKLDKKAPNRRFALAVEKRSLVEPHIDSRDAARDGPLDTDANYAITEEPAEDAESTLIVCCAKVSAARDLSATKGTLAMRIRLRNVSTTAQMQRLLDWRQLRFEIEGEVRTQRPPQSTKAQLPGPLP